MLFLASKAEDSMTSGAIMRIRQMTLPFCNGSAYSLRKEIMVCKCQECGHSDRKECLAINNCKCCYLEDMYSMLTDVEMAADSEG